MLMFQCFFVVVAVLSASLSVVADEAKVKVVTLGDSITRGVRQGVKAEETFSALLQEGLKKKGIDAQVVNSGVGGETTKGALARLDKVIALKPAVVTIMYGTNDSYVYPKKTEPDISKEQFRKNLEEIVKRLADAGIEPILMTEPIWGDKSPLNSGKHPNVRLNEYMDEVRGLAKEKKLALVDNYEHWAKINKKGTDVGTDWCTDQYHPNPRGHREIAEVMLPVVLKAVQGKTLKR
jgi:lysophospholipase L1-like esterase